MPSAALARLEQVLQSRKLDHTIDHAALRLPRRVLPTGVAEVDVRLRGGWPYGEVSELVGPRSSGRTSLLVASLVAATRAGGVAGLVDTLDRFDPATAAQAGLDLARVLWIRGPSISTAGPQAPGPGPQASGRGAKDALDRAVLNALRAFDLLIRAGGFALAVLDAADVPARTMRRLPMTTWLRSVNSRYFRAMNHSRLSPSCFLSQWCLSFSPTSNRTPILRSQFSSG